MNVKWKYWNSYLSLFPHHQFEILEPKRKLIKSSRTNNDDSNQSSMILYHHRNIRSKSGMSEIFNLNWKIFIYFSSASDRCALEINHFREN